VPNRQQPQPDGDWFEGLNQDPPMTENAPTDFLRRIMADRTEPAAARVTAAKVLMDRGAGSTDDSATVALARQVQDLTDEQLDAELARFMREGTPPPSERFTGPDDLVFPTWDGDVQYHGDLRARFYAALRAASLKRIRFHDLRHTFGTLAAQKLPIRTVQEYMGHAHISTTLIYSHYAPAGDEAALLGRAFREACPTAAEAAVSSAITA
jgi:hypothetical protein